MTDTYYKKANDVRLPIKIYEAKSDTLVLTIHGGAWYAIKEDSDQWDGGWMNFHAQYYNEKGFNAAAISYRDINLDEATTVFDLIDDCRDAVKFLKERIDFKKLIIMGDSAGAHLAVMLGFDEEINADIIIAANPVVDLTHPSWQHTAKSKDDYIKASPLFNIKKTNTQFLVLHGDCDKTVDISTSVEFCKKMQEAENDCTFIEIKGAPHAFILSGYVSTDEEVIKYMKIVDDYLKVKEERCCFKSGR